MTTAVETTHPCYRFTVDQYHRLADAGIIPRRGLELLRGVITIKGDYRDGLVVPYRFDGDQYDRMVATGILTEDDAVELLEGVIVPKMSKSPPHESTSDRLEELIRDLLPAGWRLRVEKVVTIPAGRPEPDVSVVLGPASRYNTRHPGPGDIALIAEVSDTSVGIDRTAKVRMYAEAGIPVYWIVNIPDRRIEVYTGPTTPADGGDPHYATRADYAPGQDVPVVVAGPAVGVVPVAAVLP